MTLPCERVVYLHYLVGGPRDGDMFPSAHRYEELELDGSLYAGVGNDPTPCDPGGWRLINATDDYRETVCCRVTMTYQGRGTLEGES